MNNGPAKAVRIPDLSGFSSPAFCGDFVAFWGNIKADKLLSMRISRIETGATVREQSAESTIIATDDSGYLAPPVWRASCAIARFLMPESGGETDLSIKD
jgi:hypothetical protein